MTATASRRQAILVEMLARVSEITQQNGFNTDAGLTPFLGEKVSLDDPSDPEIAICLVVRDDFPGRSMQNILVTLPIEIQAIAKADINSPWLTVESLLTDIKRAVELEDRTLGGYAQSYIERGQTRTLQREVGATTVGASITYLVPYAEAWGAP